MLTADLESLLMKLRNQPFAMKLFARTEDMEAIRHPAGRRRCTARPGGWRRRRGSAGTSASLADNLVGRAVPAVIGSATPRTTPGSRGKQWSAVWDKTPEKDFRRAGGD